jgi:hypothetical protein
MMNKLVVLAAVASLATPVVLYASDTPATNTKPAVAKSAHKPSSPKSKAGIHVFHPQSKANPQAAPKPN